MNQTGWPAGNVRAEADPAIGPGLRGRVQLLAGAGELPGRRDGVCRREEPSSYEAGLRAHGSNQRFHRLLGHAVARALNTAPRLTGLGPAAPEILILQGWRRKGARPGRCCVNHSNTHCSSDGGRDPRPGGLIFDSLSQSRALIRATDMCDPVDQLMHRVSEWFVRQPRDSSLRVGPRDGSWGSIGEVSRSRWGSRETAPFSPKRQRAWRSPPSFGARCNCARAGSDFGIHSAIVGFCRFGVGPGREADVHAGRATH